MQMRCIHSAALQRAWGKRVVAGGVVGGWIGWGGGGGMVLIAGSQTRMSNVHVVIIRSLIFKNHSVFLSKEAGRDFSQIQQTEQHQGDSRLALVSPPCCCSSLSIDSTEWRHRSRVATRPQGNRRWLVCQCLCVRCGSAAHFE